MENKKSFGERGFLGPIGDDLPSLIPLVFALMIFFGAFGVAFGAFNNRGREFEMQIEALRISTDLKSNSYFAGFEEFKQLCGSISAKGMRFRAGLVNLGERVDIFNPSFYSSNGNVFKCENTDIELSRGQVAQQRPLVREFPVALNENFVVKPKSLVIIVWR